MSKRFCITFFFSVCFVLGAGSQVITGNIKDKEGRGIPDISVTVQLPKASQFIGYTFSDRTGAYTLSYKSITDTVAIRISGLNIKTQILIAANKNQRMDFVVEEMIQELKEVLVKAPSIRLNGDTLNYLVDAFKSSKDLVIGDVLKKMPGIEVKESGQIQYNGKPITKFYIENMDLLQGRYGIATQNISAADISVVQVLENHQPVKALKDIQFSDGAAINLKIKETSRGIFSIMAKLGAGEKPLLWDNELAGTYFGRGKQNLTAYKGNNSGTDLNKELTSFTAPVIDLSGNEMVFLKMPVPPEINKSRYLRNNSNMVTVNNIFKVNGQKEINFNLTYYNDHEKRNSYARSLYILPQDSTKIITEELSSEYHTDKLDTEIRYNRNDDKAYFNNYTNFSGSWANGKSDIVTERFICQQLNNPSFSVSNALHWIKRGENDKGIELFSAIGFKTMSQGLLVNPNIYGDVLTFVSDDAGAEQDVHMYTFRFDNRCSLLSAFTLGEIKISPRIGLTGCNQRMDSRLSSADNQGRSDVHIPDSLKNNLHWGKYSASLSADLSYRARKLRVNAGVPVSFNLTTSRDRMKGVPQDLFRLYLQPSLSIIYNLSSAFELKANYRFYNETGNIYSLYTGYILQDYRRLNRYDGRLSERNGNGGNMSFAYKNIYEMLFCLVGLNYNYDKNNVLFGQYFNGILSGSSTITRPNATRYVALNGSFSKGFDWKKTVFKVNAVYTIGTSQQLQQNSIVDYRSNGYGVDASVSAQLTSRLLVIYKGAYGENWGQLNQDEQLPLIRSLVNRVSLNTPLFENCDLNFSYEHYYNNATIGDKKFSLADAGIQYSLNRFRYSVNWTNIFNTKHYVTSYYEGINTFYSAYSIRPAAVLLTVNFKLR